MIKNILIYLIFEIIAYLIAYAVHADLPLAIAIGSIGGALATEIIRLDN